MLLIPLVTSDIVGAEKMSYALGSAFTVMAFPMFLGPPIAGLYTILEYCFLMSKPSTQALSSFSLSFFLLLSLSFFLRSALQKFESFIFLAD